MNTSKQTPSSTKPNAPVANLTGVVPIVPTGVQCGMTFEETTKMLAEEQEQQK
jgi:hypothetical protein